MSKKYPATASNRHPCGKCGRQVWGKRSDGKFFSTCHVCRAPKKAKAKAMTDVSAPLRMDDIIPCRRCLWTGTVREMAYSHRAEHEW